MTATAAVDVPLGLDADCEACAARMVDDLEHHLGVEAVQHRPNTAELHVSYDRAICSPTCLEEEEARARAELLEQFAHQELRVTGMDCADCAQKIARVVGRVDEVSNLEVSFAAGRVRLEYQHHDHHAACDDHGAHR